MQLDHCLTRSIHSGRKGKVLKVSVMHFTTLSVDLAVVMVTFFKTTNWDFHPYSTLERKSKNRKDCNQKNLIEQDLPLFYPDILPTLESKSTLHSRLSITGFGLSHSWSW